MGSSTRRTTSTWRRTAARPENEDSRTLDDLVREEVRLRQELRAAQTRVEQAGARLQEQIKKLVEPAEVEEELAEATAALSRLESLSNVLQEARSLIKSGAAEHRRNAPPRCALARHR